jgi:hypothetical protein
VRELRTWLRRAAVGIAVVLAITGVGATGAAAGTGQWHPDSVVLNGDPGSEFGVQHTGRINFTIVNCEYQARSDHAVAVTERVGGTCGNDVVYVRAFVCTTGACLTTEWRTSTRGRVTYTAPSGYTIRLSYHRACRNGVCSSQKTIDHT